MNKSIAIVPFFCKRIFIKRNENIIWLLLLNIFIAFCQFLTYMIIDRLLGKEFIGIWALVIATTAFVQIASFGFSTGLVRYIPELLIQQDYSRLNKMIGTVNFLMITLSLPVLIILFFPAKIYAHHLLNEQQFKAFETTLIWVASAMVINNLFSVYSSVFDGFQKFGKRSIIQISGWIVFVVTTYFIIPTFGLQGVGIALLFQNVWQYVLALIFIHREKFLNNPLSVSFDSASFKLISSFGFKYQSIGVLSVFLDPIIKYFITRNIGLSGTANFELANKITIQLRNLLVSTNQILVPKLVTENSKGNLNLFFSATVQKNTTHSIFLGLITLFFSPVAIWLFFNKIDSTLITIIAVMNVGWVFNMITSPHYYSSIALDKVGSLVSLHVTSALFTIFSYLIIDRTTAHQYYYILIPTISLILGSVYNSFVLFKLKNSFFWLRSSQFLLFLLISFFVIIIPYYNLFQLYIMLTLGVLLMLLMNHKKLKQAIITCSLFTTK